MADNPAPAPPDGYRQRQTWTSGAKDIVTTSLTARVWATVGKGIVTEVFWPAVDQPQVKDFGFLVRAGSGADAQWWEAKADGAYTVEPHADPAVPLATVTHTGTHYRLSFQVIADPAHDALLLDYRLDRPKGAAPEPIALYPLLAPHLGSYTASSGPNTGTDNIAWLQDGALFARDNNGHVLCLIADPGFHRASVGYVGISDGWSDLYEHAAMQWEYTSAGPGVVAMMGELSDPTGELAGTLALGFGTNPADAESSARASLLAGPENARATLVRQWQQYAQTLALPHPGQVITAPVAAAVKQSATLLRCCADRSSGGIVAGLSTPWGNDTNDPGGYHMVWCRDGSETALALAALGDLQTASALLDFLAAQQRLDDTQAEVGSWGRCYFLDGSSLPGLQLDETAFPVLLAAKLEELGLTLPDGIRTMIRQAVRYLVRNGPVHPPEAVDRWEETAGGSPYTLALIVVALVAAAPSLSDAEREYVLALADNWNERIEEFCYVADTEVDRAFATAGHYVRIGPTADTIKLGNQIEAGTTLKAEQMVGMEFLYLPRLGLRDSHDRRITDTVTIVDRMLLRRTASGDAYNRYDVDGYGEWLDGSGWPVRGFGIGRPWPLLVGERGHYDALAGGDAAARLAAMLAMRGRGGLLPEQVWDAGDLPWRDLTNGHPTASAMPLAWAHSEFVKLAIMLSAGDGRPVERLAAVDQRYSGQVPESGTWYWSGSAPFSALPSECTLVIVDTQQFTLHCGFDGWQQDSIADLPAESLPFDLYGVTLSAGRLAGHTSLQFTRRYPAGWEGRDYQLGLGAPRSGIAALRPATRTSRQPELARLRR
ncbi:MAG TPA: glycoside hydrolase family 15 protein [Jatrophihabitans sp.]|nr:glycoside hydrolase family 15 protein [Jatrophihabitans sp.]